MKLHIMTLCGELCCRSAIIVKCVIRSGFNTDLTGMINIY